MLHLMDAFLVCPLLLLFTPHVAFHQWAVSVALGQKPVAWMSTLASLVVIALPSDIRSPNNV